METKVDEILKKQEILKQSYRDYLNKECSSNPYSRKEIMKWSELDFETANCELDYYIGNATEGNDMMPCKCKSRK